MAYDARQIANWFIARAAKEGGRTLSIMSLLKLAYIAHGWHLETQDGAPLFGNVIRAWQHGPVIPDVYNSFRAQGIEVRRQDPTFSPELGQETEALLEEVWGLYGQLPPFQLSDLTHVRGGPWDIAMKSGGKGAKIPDELILQHYKAKRNAAAHANG